MYNEFSNKMIYLYKKILLENGYSITLRMNGTWRTEGQAMNSSPGFAMGIKDDYYDPHF